ncbi:3-hydroxyisobutyryl-CoA hydrolase-like protein 1, mitochondrial [Brassica rapa]|uniref:3-hydroxyisobutyryl-CoA hydrolase-like protein 1, mitochondrial n=1 Tax=Brassica campestris TaxID=3711 RepID=UPI00142E3B6B|nr:3-hydroxyisobutyryl-CoA hydrolase-like protein 1, mitochondrial [Brassica rapa]
MELLGDSLCFRWWWEGDHPRQARLGLEGDSSVNDIGFLRRLAERDCKVLSLAGFLCVQIREARNQTLGDCLKKEFRITVNIMRSTISIDAFEGVRALTIAKDNCPRWNPATLDEVDDEKIKLVFKPLEDDLELRIPETEENRFVRVGRQSRDFRFCISTRIKRKSREENRGSCVLCLF